MRTVFTQEELNEMRRLQRKLDTRVKKENDIPADANLNIEKFLALKTELFELANEIESFKYWKKNKNKTNQLEEACDVLHFILSIAIDNRVELVEEKQPGDYNTDEYDMNDLWNDNEDIRSLKSLILFGIRGMGMLDCMISDMFIEKDWEDLNQILLVLGVVVNKCGYDIEDLYKCYKDKNKENHKRQDNKY